MEGNQKDYRSRCEFDVPYLIKSALWCCIVHITRKKQQRWIVERNLSNGDRRGGYHIALGKNMFVKLDKLVEEDESVTQIPVKSSIIWKGGKKIITSSGIIDGKTYNRRKNKCISYVQIKFLAFVRSSLEVSVVRDCSINFCKKCLTLLIVFA